MDGNAGQVLSVRWLDNGARLASVGNSSIRVWDGFSGETVSTFEEYHQRLRAIGWSRSGSRLALADDLSPSEPWQARVWDMTSMSPVSTIQGVDRSVNSIGLSSDGSRLASGGIGRAVHVWDLASGDLIFTLKTPIELGFKNVNSVRWAPDGSRLASAGSSRLVRVWDMASGMLERKFEGPVGWGIADVQVAEWSADGAQLAMSTGTADNNVRVWDVTSSELVSTLHGHDRSVRSVDWSPDRSRLASASEDGTVRVWNVRADESIRSDASVPSDNTESHITEAARNHIFISYRRADTQADAGRLHSDLASEFGEQRLFMDVDNVPLGENVQSYIRDAISRSAVLLAVIGPDWSPERLQKETDWVRLEIESAFEFDVRIVPIRVRRAEMPGSNKLPESMADFSVLNAAELEHQSWRRDLEPVLEALRRILD